MAPTFNTIGGTLILLSFFFSPFFLLHSHLLQKPATSFSPPSLIIKMKMSISSSSLFLLSPPFSHRQRGFSFPSGNEQIDFFVFPSPSYSFLSPSSYIPPCPSNFSFIFSPFSFMSSLFLPLISPFPPLLLLATSHQRVFPTQR